MTKSFKLALISAFWSRLGGGEIGANLLRKGLENKGVMVKILTTQQTNHNKNFIPIDFKIPIPKEIILLGNFLLDKLFKRTIESAFKRYNFFPDIIHVQNIYALPGSVEVAKKLKIPIIVTIREPLPKVLLHPYNFLFKFFISQILKSRNRILIKILKEKCDRVITVSDYIKKRLSKLGIPKNKMVTIYNFPPKWNKLDLIEKKSKQLGQNKLYTLVYSGRLEKAKGIHILIQAMKTILSSIKNIRLLIAGEGPYENILKNLCSELKLNKYIKFLGKIPFNKMIRLYQLADVVCIPSIWPEPLSRVSFEAMSIGTPVISTKVGGMTEVIENRKTGLLVSPNNSGELANAIMELIKDQALRDSLGEEGKGFINKRFDSEISIKDHLELYKKLL